jgi:carbon storage regulator CsrA
MLVVTRDRDQAIRIGSNVVVRVLKVGERQVSLGIEAPPTVPVQLDEAVDERTESHSDEVSLRVLVVEDTPIHAGLIERALTERSGFQVRIVPTGEQAIELLEASEEPGAFKPDLILLDLNLPRRSGLEVLGAIRAMESYRRMPVIMLSCADSQTDVARCIEAGANAFVSKSETYRDFRQSIYRLADFWSHARCVG